MKQLHWSRALDDRRKPVVQSVDKVSTYKNFATKYTPFTKYVIFNLKVSLRFELGSPNLFWYVFNYTMKPIGVNKINK